MLRDGGLVAGNVTDKYRTRHPLARLLMRRFLRAVGNLYLEVRPFNLLEVGCGDGRMTRRYADRAALVLALDPNNEKIERAIDSTPEPLRSKVRFRVADIADAELAQQAFEVAILSHSL